LDEFSGFYVENDKADPPGFSINRKKGWRNTTEIKIIESINGF